MIRRLRRFALVGFPLLLLITACGGSSTTPVEGNAPALPSGVFAPASTDMITPDTNSTIITPIPNAGTSVQSTAFITADSAGGSGGAFVPANTAAAPGNNGITDNTGNTTDNTGNTGTTGTCQQPAGWFIYTVQPGDILSDLAQRSGVEINELVTANCLTDPDAIMVGQTLYLPPAFGGVSTP